VVFLYAPLDAAIVDPGPCFVEAFVLPVGQVELFSVGVARGDQHMDVGIVGIGVKRIERRVVPEPGGLDPLSSHIHRPVRFHFAIEAQHRTVVPPLSPALLSVLAQVIGNAAASLPLPPTPSPSSNAIPASLIYSSSKPPGNTPKPPLPSTKPAVFLLRLPGSSAPPAAPKGVRPATLWK